MSISGLSGSNAMMQFYNIKEEAELKSYVNKLLREFDSAGTKEAKDKVAAQLKSLASSSGASLSDLGASRASDTSIFSPKLAVAPTATPTATQAIANTADATTAVVAPANIAANATPGGILPASIPQTHVNPNGRDAATKARDQSVIADLQQEFSVKNKALWAWSNVAKASDKMNVYDGKTGQLKAGERMGINDIVYIDSAKYGLVKIQVGGDGALNGNDDVIIEMGGKAAANGTVNGLNKVNENLAQATTANAIDQAVAKPVSIQEGIAKFNETGQPVWNKAECPICQGIGCKYCTGEAAKAAVATTAQADQAKALVNTPAVDIATIQQPGLTGVIDQLQNPYQLSESNIRNLLAAILLMINQINN